jgi:hypothetical protein
MQKRPWVSTATRSNAPNCLEKRQIHGLRGLTNIIASKTEVIVTANHLTQRKFACRRSHALQDSKWQNWSQLPTQEKRSKLA